MEKKWRGTWPAECDICMYFNDGVKTDLRNVPYFVDGATRQGPWALMCPECHAMHGVGLGTGRGQKYDSKTLVKLEG